jgi:photosystem II stability/assembly factor-like uncharacterized protein
MNREMKVGGNHGWFVFIAMLALPYVLQAQVWQQVYPSFPADDITSLVHWNGDTIFAFGLNWTILRSDDAGANWKTIAHNNNGYNIMRAERAGNSIILMPIPSWFMYDVATDSSTFLLYSYNPRTNDTARITVPVAHPYTRYFEFYDIAANDQCIAVLQSGLGMAVALSFDGGKSWDTRDLSSKVGSHGSDGSITMRDNLRGVVACWDTSSKSYQAYLTDDGFQTVHTVPGVTYIRNGYTKLFTKFPIACIDDSTIVLVNGGSTPVISRDRGTTWVSMSRVNTQIVSLQFRPGGVGYAVGAYWDAYKTTDWGTSWIKIRNSMWGSQYYAYAPSSLSLNDDALIISGLGGMISKTNDGGVTWDEFPGSDAWSFQSIYFADRQKGVAFTKDRGDSFGYFRHTSDGGRTWQGKNLVDKVSMPFDQFYYLSDQIIFAYGQATNGNLIYKSSDGGAIWSCVLDTNKFGIKKLCSNFYGIPFRNLQHRGNDSLYFYSDKGLIKSVDGGNTWTLMPDNIPNRANGFVGLDASVPGTLWLLTNTYLEKSTDDGASWNRIRYPDTLSRVQMFATKSGAVFVISKDQVRATYTYKTTDDGNSWTNYRNPYNHAGALQIFPSGRGCILGTPDYPEMKAATLNTLYSPYFIQVNWLQYTTDDCKTSHPGAVFCSSRQNDLLSFYFLDENNGWVGMTNGILRTSNGGINWVEMPSQLASGIALDPAYPNPASSSATISFTVSGGRDAAVQIDVYDAMGRKAGNVYSGVKAPGKHSALFDASRLRAGVYFVRMTTGKEMKVEKLVVMK